MEVDFVVLQKAPERNNCYESPEQIEALLDSQISKEESGVSYRESTHYSQ